MSFYSGLKVMVAGGSGMIGRELVSLLLKSGASVRVVSMDDPANAPDGTEFLQLNLMNFDNCVNACHGMDIVFQLLGVKGSPQITNARPASLFVPIITLNTNMMEAARRCDVGRFLYTSSIGVYAPAEVFQEDSVWQTFPSPNDRFGGWAKRMGELQAEAYRIEYGWQNVSIVRPANVYGAYDNFDTRNAMVIPSLIRRALDGENPLVVWGEGSAIRDFIHARDVARGMMILVDKGELRPVNLGSGTGNTIREVVDTILSNMANPPEVIWDTSKPTGDTKRLMDVSRARELGIGQTTPLAQGIPEVMNWYLSHGDIISKRYNVFTDSEFAPASNK